MQAFNFSAIELEKFNNQFQQNGYTHISQVLSLAHCHQLLAEIHSHLAVLIEKHGCLEAEYLGAVNRWPASSLLDGSSLKALVNILKPKVCEILGKQLIPYEIDILYKSPYAKEATPAHQDIAYAVKKPYFASTWLTLRDVGINDSPLSFLPKSHEYPILPAIDFWQPNYIDEVQKSLEWKENAKVMVVSCGDVLLFSSKIWHASSSHRSAYPRWVLVIRWGNKKIIYEEIPRPKSVPFGMWNCGHYTASVLKEGLGIVANYQPNDFIEIVKSWQALIYHNKLPFYCNHIKSLNALEKLRILHEAHLQYQGGDGQGVVYPALWLCFLKNLQDYMFSIKLCK